MHSAVKGVGLYLLCAALPAITAIAAEPPPLPVYDHVIGEQVIHTVTQGETLVPIAKRFGMAPHLAAVVNRLPDPNRLHLGQRLLLSTRRIVPATLRDGIVINAGDLTLYWLRDGEVAESFPVGVGRVAWQTPSGHYTIVSRRHDPVWHVPPSIQREMKEQGHEVKKKVPPGPDNPLGKYWLQLSVPAYGIHGTNAPWSVGKYTTHGCVRMRPDDIERLYRVVPNGTPVDVIDDPVKLARIADDMILLEAHPGPDERTATSVAQIVERVRASEVGNLVDLETAARVIRDAWGIAVAVNKTK